MMNNTKNFVNCVCYKLETPMVTNKGTKWEKSCDTFLSYLSYKSYAETVAEVEAINSGKVAKLFNGQPSQIENRKYYVEVQEDKYY